MVSTRIGSLNSGPVRIWPSRISVSPLKTWALSGYRGREYCRVQASGASKANLSGIARRWRSFAKPPRFGLVSSGTPCSHRPATAFFRGRRKAEIGLGTRPDQAAKRDGRPGWADSSIAVGGRAGHGLPLSD
jgi:hypothetical protein